MRLGRAKRIIKLGIASLWLHKLRSFLTVLGVVFGVSSVVSMLAIGEGASYEAQQQIRELGSHNIIVKSVKPPEDDSAGAKRERVAEYGLKYADAQLIRDTVPSVDHLSAARHMRRDIRVENRRSDSLVVATGPRHIRATNLKMSEGRWLSQIDVDDHRDVCILGASVADKLFALEYPLAQTVKIGNYRFRVVGVLLKRGRVPGEATSATGDSADNSVYVPLTTFIAHFGEMLSKVTTGSRANERVQLHQIIIQVRHMEQVVETGEIIEQILARTHGKADYEVTVPLELLRQAEKTKRIYSIVLGSIAAISLIVGGIGIMNIMLASVTERTREIGIRRALGARQRDVMTQFLVETVILSGSGGLFGLLLGVTIPVLVTQFTDMKTIVTPFSLIISFGISALVGVVFGLYPAYRAAQMDPIEALRHE